MHQKKSFSIVWVVAFLSALGLVSSFVLPQKKNMASLKDAVKLQEVSDTLICFKEFVSKEDWSRLKKLTYKGKLQVAVVVQKSHTLAARAKTKSSVAHSSFIFKQATKRTRAVMKVQSAEMSREAASALDEILKKYEHAPCE